MKISCVYAIKNKENGKIYIGQTVNLNKRWKSHKSHLNSGKHFNSHLQASWDKFGEDAFSFEILEECSISKLDKLERRYIKEFSSGNPDRGYNMMHGGQKFREFTDEVKKRMSDARKGVKFSAEHKKRISEAKIGQKMSATAIEKRTAKKKERMCGCGEKNGNSVMSDSKARKVLEALLSGDKVSSIMQMYDIPQNSVYNLMYGRTYTHIMPELRNEIANRNKTQNEEKEKEAIKLLSAGVSQNEISKKLSMSRNTIRRIAERTK